MSTGVDEFLEIFERIRNKHLRKLVVSPEEAAGLIQTGMTIGIGGYVAAGYPKVIPQELVKRAEMGEDLKLNFICGANMGPEIDDALSQTGIMQRRIPYHANRNLSKLINNRKVNYVELTLDKISQMIQNDYLNEIDVAIIEATAITEEGFIVPTTGVGLSPAFIRKAKNIIIEVNTAQPKELEGLHDIYLPALPPDRKPIPLVRVNQKIGEPFMRVDIDKIKYIVESDIPDTIDIFNHEDAASQKIAGNLLNFIELEIEAGRLPKKLLPIQSGIGNIANSIVRGFKESNFHDLEFYCGIIQDSILELVNEGKIVAVSGGAFAATQSILERLKETPDFYKERMVLRPVDLSNNGEVANRLGLISLNVALEIDIYGNANASHLMGSKVINGIGGGSGFAKNAFLSVMMLPSKAKGGDISSIVPMVSHCDITDHDIDVIITDSGVADLRGKDPVERAYSIIENCADPIYKDMLRSYLERAIKHVGGHVPHLLEEAFSWHIRFQKTGSMKEC
jgi:succinyl-CoA:acetate CoA-transferase